MLLVGHIVGGRYLVNTRDLLRERFGFATRESIDYSNRTNFLFSQFILYVHKISVV